MVGLSEPLGTSCVGEGKMEESPGVLCFRIKGFVKAINVRLLQVRHCLGKDSWAYLPLSHLHLLTCKMEVTKLSSRHSYANPVRVTRKRGQYQVRNGWVCMLIS